MTQRIPLPDGQWADVRDWLTHGEAKAVRKAWLAAGVDIASAPDVDTALVRAYVEAWHVIGRDGQPVPLERVEDAPSAVLDGLVPALTARWQGRADPNGIGSSSISSQPEPTSTSDPTTTPSATSSSS